MSTTPLSAERLAAMIARDATAPEQTAAVGGLPRLTTVQEDRRLLLAELARQKQEVADTLRGLLAMLPEPEDPGLPHILAVDIPVYIRETAFSRLGITLTQS